MTLFLDVMYCVKSSVFIKKKYKTIFEKCKILNIIFNPLLSYLYSYLFFLFYFFIYINTHNSSIFYSSYPFYLNIYLSILFYQSIIYQSNLYPSSIYPLSFYFNPLSACLTIYLSIYSLFVFYHPIYLSTYTKCLYGFKTKMILSI